MKKTILVEEDDAMYLKILQEALNMKGYKVLEVANSEEIVEEARIKLPDLIIINTQVPLRLQAVNLLKADERTAEIPIWALTSNHLPIDKEKFLKAGCETYQLKPSDVDQVYNFLEKINIQLSDLQE